MSRLDRLALRLIFQPLTNLAAARAGVTCFELSAHCAAALAAATFIRAVAVAVSDGEAWSVAINLVWTPIAWMMANDARKHQTAWLAGRPLATHFGVGPSAGRALFCVFLSLDVIVGVALPDVTDIAAAARDAAWLGAAWFMVCQPRPPRAAPKRTGIEKMAALGRGLGQVFAGPAGNAHAGRGGRALVLRAPLVAHGGADGGGVERRALALADGGAEELALDGGFAVGDQDLLQELLVPLDLDALGLELAEPIDDVADGLILPAKIHGGVQAERGQRLEELPGLGRVAADLMVSVIAGTGFPARVNSRLRSAP